MTRPLPAPTDTPVALRRIVGLAILRQSPRLIGIIWLGWDVAAVLGSGWLDVFASTAVACAIAAYSTARTRVQMLVESLLAACFALPVTLVPLAWTWAVLHAVDRARPDTLFPQDAIALTLVAIAVVHAVAWPRRAAEARQLSPREATRRIFLPEMLRMLALGLAGMLCHFARDALHTAALLAVVLGGALLEIAGEVWLKTWLMRQERRRSGSRQPR